MTDDAWIEPERIVELNDAPERRGDYVLYWMQQSQREPFNPALELAVAEANRLALPVRGIHPSKYQKIPAHRLLRCAQQNGYKYT